MNKLYRWYVYFRRGHLIYLAFFANILNFLTIQYYLLIKNVGFLRELFPSFWVFVVIVGPVYVVLAVLIGWWDYKRGVYKAESSIMAKENPFTNDFVEALIKFMEGDKEEAIRILSKWGKSLREGSLG